MDVQWISQEGGHVLRLEDPLRGHFHQKFGRVVHFGRAVGRHASVLATVPGGELLEDEQAEEFGHPLLDLQCEQLLGEF